MKPKRKLKEWVKICLLLLPQIVIISQLFFVGSKINKIIKQPDVTVVTETRCRCHD